MKLANKKQEKLKTFSSW